MSERDENIAYEEGYRSGLSEATEAETARLRSVIDMLSTALTVAMGGKPNCTATETQLIRSALLIARGIVAKADLNG